ncbi:GNAT family N-acetyltransferase [Streptomyces sp. NPDC096033]|uniref:GNAT family N-acetyltransferase n=1 Tax=Streptomyces sp. NPDC096033 TaxID=3366071 RepID=UPI0038299141
MRPDYEHVLSNQLLALMGVLVFSLAAPPPGRTGRRRRLQHLNGQHAVQVAGPAQMPDTSGTAAARPRHRVREEALADAMRIARGLLVDEGSGAVTVRAVAREMGLTAPGLYRYYAGHRELLQEHLAGAPVPAEVIYVFVASWARLLGYRLNRPAWGRGYATEGARALIDKGFTELGVERVTANTMAVNTASRRVMEKSGLSFLRHFNGDWPEAIEGSEHGEVEYELTRAGWERNR